jgi:hypothetical protein
VKSETLPSSSEWKLQNLKREFAIVQESSENSDVCIILDFIVLSSVFCETLSHKISGGQVRLNEVLILE